MGRRLKIALGALVAAASAVVAAGARADDATPTTSALSWVRLPGTEACLPASDLGGRVEARLRRPVFVSPSTADVAIEGHVERRAKPPGFLVVVKGTRRDGTTIGTRELAIDGADCRAIEDSLVLVIALLIDPDAATTPPPTPPPAATEPPREIVHERVIVREIERPAPEPPPQANRAWHLDASLAGTVAFGRVPGGAPGAALEARGGVGAFALQAALATIPHATLDAGDGRSVDYWLIEGGLAVCPWLALGARVEGGACGGLRVGNLRAIGSGWPDAHEVNRAVVDGAVDARGIFFVAKPLFVALTASLLVPFVRERTTETTPSGIVVLAERPAVGAEVALGIGVRFAP